MKVTVEMDNLEKLVSSTMEENIENVIKHEVDKYVKKTVETNIKKSIEEVVSKNLTDFVDDYIKNTQIKIGGGYWNETLEETLTVEQFIKRQLKDQMESKTLRCKKEGRKSSYNDDYENVSFESYINRTFDVASLIQKELDSFMESTKKDINKKIKNSFTSTTKDMLSESVFNVLMNNDTYKKIQDNIAYIADRHE